jgi:hypothetical protein
MRRIGGHGARPITFSFFSSRVLGAISLHLSVNFTFLAVPHVIVSTPLDQSF